MQKILSIIFGCLLSTTLCAFDTPLAAYVRVVANKSDGTIEWKRQSRRGVEVGALKKNKKFFRRSGIKITLHDTFSIKAEDWKVLITVGLHIYSQNEMRSFRVYVHYTHPSLKIDYMDTYEMIVGTKLIFKVDEFETKVIADPAQRSDYLEPFKLVEQTRYDLIT